MTVEGFADKVKGSAKKAAGKITDDPQLETKGKLDKAKGAAHIQSAITYDWQQAPVSPARRSLGCQNIREVRLGKPLATRLSSGE